MNQKRSRTSKSSITRFLPRYFLDAGVRFVFLIFFLSVSVTPSPGSEVSATFTALGSGSNLYSRYYSGNVFSGILKMQVEGVSYDSYCIDLFTPIRVGDSLVANGSLTEDIRASVNWCAVNYILSNFDYTQTYGSGHPLYNLSQNQRAAAIQAAIWYFVTAPYGPYPGTGGRYQYMTDPTNTTNYDARPLRTQAVAIVSSVPANCDDSFKFPVAVDLAPVNPNACSDMPFTATVRDQNGDPLSGITVTFEAAGGLVTPTSDVSDGSGEAETTLTALSVGQTAHVAAYATGRFGTLLYDPNYQRQSLTTTTLIPRSIAGTTDATCDAAPQIDIEKYVSSNQADWYDADVPPGLYVPLGQNVYFKFVVTNTGNVSLTSVTVLDSEYGSICSIETLEVSSSQTCSIGPYQAPAGMHKNTAAVEGQYDGTTVTDEDDASYETIYEKSGIVFQDCNRNGIYDPGEPVFPNITVWLCFDCPVGGAAPCNTLAITKTDDSGRYVFPDLPGRSYVVSIPRTTDDPADGNESLFGGFILVETDKVKFNQEMQRACIFFTLDGNERDNDFGFAAIKIPALNLPGVFVLMAFLLSGAFIVMSRRRKSGR